jgi:hypothetical protein
MPTLLHLLPLQKCSSNYLSLEVQLRSTATQAVCNFSHIVRPPKCEGKAQAQPISANAATTAVLLQPAHGMRNHLSCSNHRQPGNMLQLQVVHLQCTQHQLAASCSATSAKRNSVEHAGLHQSMRVPASPFPCRPSCLRPTVGTRQPKTDNPTSPWQRVGISSHPTRQPQAGPTPQRMPQMSFGPLRKAQCVPHLRGACAAAGPLRSIHWSMLPCAASRQGIHYCTPQMHAASGDTILPRQHCTNTQASATSNQPHT